MHTDAAMQTHILGRRKKNTYGCNQRKIETAGVTISDNRMRRSSFDFYIYEEEKQVHMVTIRAREKD